MIEKIYDPNGNYKLNFAVGDEEKVKEFTGEDPSKFKIVNDEVFGKAYEIPCRVEGKLIFDNKLLKLLDKAIVIATNAHTGQTDKAGIPYILHPIRVMMSVDTIPEKIVAILHDILEDTTVTFDSLLKEGFPEWILNNVVILTKDKQETYDRYLLSIKSNPIATKVKLADMRDNSDILRFHNLEIKHLKMINKYHKGIKMLTKDVSMLTRL